jgi:hypothetical protein
MVDVFIVVRGTVVQRFRFLPDLSQVVVLERVGIGGATAIDNGTYEILQLSRPSSPYFLLSVNLILLLIF